MPLHEPANITAVDVSRIVGVWYVEMAEHLGCLFMVFADVDGKHSLVSAVSDWKTPVDHHPVWHKSPVPMHDDSHAIDLARMGHKMLMRRLGLRNGWELIRGGRTGDEFLEALGGMPGVTLIREHFNA